MESRISRLGKCIPDFDVVPIKEMIDKNDAGSWGTDPVDIFMNVVRSTNFNDSGYLDLSDVAKRYLDPEKYEELKLQENEILIERSGGSENQPVGRVSFITKEVADQGFAFANFLQRISVKAEIDPKFLFYCLYQMHSAGFTQIMQNQTNSIRNLEYRYFLRQLLPKPDFPEQQKIASIIISVDEMIKATQDSIDKLELLKKSLMQNMLTGKMKPDGTWRTKDEFYLDEKFGKVPIGWIIDRIKSFGEVVTGKTPPTENPNNFSNSDGYMFITPGDIGENIFVTSAVRFLSASGIRYSYKVPENSVAFVSIGSTIGKIAIVSKESCTNQQINTIVLNDKNHFLYLYYLLSFKSSSIKSIAGTTATPQINKSDLSKFKVIKSTSFDEQKLIGEQIFMVDNQKILKQSKISELDKLKKSLMQNLLTGKVRVK